ncbi:substrate-binding periplasmic protein [Rheinheimera gaetbuli]
MLLAISVFLAASCLLPDSEPVKQPLPVNLITESWPGYTDSNQSGAYFDLVRFIFPADDIRLSIDFSSFSRSISALQHQRADMTLAVSKSERTKLLFSALPMDQDRIVALHHPARTKIDSIDSLRSLRLAWNMGYDYGNILGLGNEGYEVVNIKQAIDMVSKNRVDAFLSERALLRNHTRQIKLLNLNWTEVATDDVYVAFADSAKGRYLKCYWDASVQAKLADGSHKQFYLRNQGLYFAEHF